MNTFEIRGIKFKKTGGKLGIDELAALYLVMRAVEGDTLAIELLNTGDIRVVDFEGKLIYPKDVK